MKRILTPLWLLGTMIVLLMLMLVLQRYQPAAPRDGIYNAKSLAATGFIILAAFSMGEFFRWLRLPQLLGYIAAGILFGPNFAELLPGHPQALFGQRVINDLALINVVIVGVIGTLGGGELKISELKSNFITICAVVLLNVAILVPLTFLVVWHIPTWAPSILPFADKLASNDILALAMMCAVFGTATSPTVTIAVLQEVRAKGPLTSLVLGTVVFADLALVALVLIALSFSKLLSQPEGASTAALLSALPGIAGEFGAGILIGIGTGLITILYLRFIKREEILFSVALIITASYVCKIFHAETLLAFLTAGFVVQNFSSRGHDMIAALERISLPVFVIYFMTQAAQLNLHAVTDALWITVILTLLRLFSLVVSTRVAGTITGTFESARRTLWMCVFSRGSVDLVLAGLVAASIPTWGKDFQLIIMSMVVFHIILGPPLLKRALDSAGETEQARATHKAETEAIDRRITEGLAAPTPELPTPHFESEELNARMSAIRDRLANLHRSLILFPVEARAARFRSAFDQIDKLLAQLLVRLDELGPNPNPEALQAARIEYERDIKHAISSIEDATSLAIDEQAIDRLLQQVRGLEPFGRVYRIPGEAHLFEARPGDRTFLRFVKLIRRIRRFVRGKGIRTVPLGRLWRYYVELSIPVSLARAAEEATAEDMAVWRMFVEYQRGIEDLFADPIKNASKKELLRKHMPALRAKMESAHAVSLDRFSRSLVVPFSDFIAAAERAGTLELPSFKYRPSSRFDAARRAEQRLRSLIRQQQETAGGLQGWIVMRHHLRLFTEWTRRYRSKLVELLSKEVLEPCKHELDSVQGWCRRLLEGDELKRNGEKDWATGLHRWVEPAIGRAVRRVEQLLYAFGQGAAGRELHDLLVVRISAIPNELRLPTVNPMTEGANDLKATMPVQLREWFMANLAREVSLRLVELRERVQQAMRSTLESLEEIEQVLEFNLVAAQREAHAQDPFARSELAAGGLQRALKMTSEVSEALEKKIGESSEWILRETDTLVEQTVQPLREHRLDELRRAAARRAAALLREKGESWISRRLRRIAFVSQQLYRRWSPSFREALLELSRLIVEEQRPLRPAEIRTRLRPELRSSEGDIPIAYRRIFAPAPLEIAEFYVNRAELESGVMEAIGQWAEGTPASILLYGDRGSGKRSLLQHVMAQVAPRLAETPVYELLLDEESSTEEEIARQLGAKFSESPPISFDSLARLIQASKQRKVIIIENGEKLFWRSQAGLEVCRRFLKLISATNNEVLWIVLMGAPAANWLEMMLGLFDYFTHEFEIGPLDRSQIEEMIHRRHRVSGFHAVYDRARPRLVQWMTRPFATAENIRRPQEHFFVRLDEESRGNPLMALLLWLESAHVDSADDGVIHFSPVHEQPELVHNLSIGKQQVLAALIQHGALTLAQLVTIMREEPERIRTELGHLARLGFVEPVGIAESYRLRPLAEGLATRELRRMNLL